MINWGYPMRKEAVLGLALSLGLIGCVAASAPVDQRNSLLTQGNVQLNLKVGETTKADVLDSFGSPNVTTRDGAGREVWSYQRQASVAQTTSSEGYWTIVLAGGATSTAGFSQSSRMMTLIIKFDASDIVADFVSRESNF